VSGDGSYTHLSFHFGSDFRAHCSTYSDQVPILSITARGVSVSITPAGRDASDEALEVARALAREVQAFAADVERLHAARNDGTGADSSGTDDNHDSTADGHAA
jgi:hypothetical protein